jgi:hypothetical protein
MFNRLKGARPSPALVISLVALFVSLGGVGYAAVTITGKNVKNSSLTGKDVKNSSLTGSDVKNSSLTGSDIKNNKLTGSDVLESSLGKVPSATSATSATSAGNANTVGGKSPAQLRPTSAFGQSDTPITVTTGTTVATTTISTASAGTLQATGSVEIEGTVTNPSRSQCRIEIDASLASLLYENVGDGAATTATASENTIAVNGSRSGVPAGTHTVSLLCSALSGSTIVRDDAAISVLGIPDA